MRKLIAALCVMALASCAAPAFAQPSPAQSAALDQIDADASQFVTIAATQAANIKAQTAAIRASLAPVSPPPVVVTPPPVVTPPATSSTGPLGVYVSDGSSAKADLAAYISMMGRTPQWCLVFADQSGNWANEIASLQSQLAGEYGPYKSCVAAGAQTVYSIPIFPKGGTYAAAVAGSYDANWKSVAQAIVKAAGTAKPFIVRPTWESNGNWMTYAMPAGGEANFVAAFRRFVVIIRPICPNCLFDWNVNIQTGTSASMVKAYPGDDVVDIVSGDSYYDTAYDSADPAKAWAAKLGSVNSAIPTFAWLANMATTHGKRLAVPEWGVNTNNAATYVNLFAAWAKANNVAYQIYWNSDDAFTGKLTHYPAAQAAYRAAFAQ